MIPVDLPPPIPQVVENHVPISRQHDKPVKEPANPAVPPQSAKATIPSKRRSKRKSKNSKKRRKMQQASRRRNR